MSDVSSINVLGQSFFEQVVSYVGKDHLRYVEVVVDGSTSTADVTMCLKTDSWEEQSRAIDKMIELRVMYFGELSFDYTFIPEPPAAARADQFDSQYELV